MPFTYNGNKYFSLDNLLESRNDYINESYQEEYEDYNNEAEKDSFRRIFKEAFENAVEECGTPGCCGKRTVFVQEDEDEDTSLQPIDDDTANNTTDDFDNDDNADEEIPQNTDDAPIGGLNVTNDNPGSDEDPEKAKLRQQIKEIIQDVLNKM